MDTITQTDRQTDRHYNDDDCDHLVMTAYMILQISIVQAASVK